MVGVAGRQHHRIRLSDDVRLDRRRHRAVRADGIPRPRHGLGSARRHRSIPGSGAAGSIGDIGTHAENLAEYITGLKIKELAADITAFVKGRKLDDDGNVLLRFQGGAKGILHCSQISVGEENNLNIRVFGTKGSLQWFQENPNELIQQVAQRTGLAPEKARTAVDTVLGFLKNKLPTSIGSQLDGAVSGKSIGGIGGIGGTSGIGDVAKDVGDRLGGR